VTARSTLLAAVRSEIVSAEKLGQRYVLNNPRGGVEHYDAVALGVYARPLNEKSNSQ
jgi:hypothetical protein